MKKIIELNTMLLNLIYKITISKTQDDLIKKGTQEIVKTLNCTSGSIISFADFDKKIKNNLSNNDIELNFITTYLKKPYDILEIKQLDGFFYAFKLSKYGLLLLNRDQTFKQELQNQLVHFFDYFGTMILNSVFNFEQQEKQNTINNQLRLQELLISISTKYINADLSDINNLVNKSLKQICKFVEADRSYIFKYDFSNNTTSNTHEWCANDIEPEIENLQNIPIDFISYWVEAHKKNEAFYVDDVSLLPDDGEFGLKGLLEPQGIKSLITIPKFKNNQLIGFIGFDSVKKINLYSENEKNILFVFANMLVNVIQRKETEEQIKEQENKKEQLLNNLALKNEELNEYAHVVSHDLKAPLRNIDTLVNWVIDDNKDEMQEKCLNSLNLVLSNVEKMDLLIKGILDYSTIDKLESEDRQINFNLIIEEVLRSIKIPENFEINIDENLPIVYGNAWRYKQVFQNLIQNSIIYNDKEIGIINIGVVENEDHYEFFINDNGLGIKSIYFDRIFKVFTKLENNNLSSGVGLSIVKKIIQFYKGAIWLESEEKKGTTFYFTIPKK